VAEVSPRRSGLVIHGGRSTHDQRSRRTAPNTHADSGGPTPEASSGCARELALAGPDTHAFPASPPFKSDWLTPRKECPVRHGWRLGRIVRAKSPVDHGSRSGGGREDVGWPTARAPFSLGQRHADPALVPRPSGGPRPAYTTTAVEIDGRGRRPIKASGCLGSPGPQRRSRCSLVA
jgi:hypothetical protein